MSHKINIDDIDRRILRMLVRDARMSFLEIARECNISGAAIHQRIKKLTDAGVILGSGLEVNPKSLGFDVCAIVGIRVSDQAKNYDTAEQLRSIPDIVECHYITGKYNILIKVYCRDNERLMHVILDEILMLPTVSSTETFISLSNAFTRSVNLDALDE